MQARCVILPLIIVAIMLGAAVFSLTMLNKNKATPSNYTTNQTSLNSSNNTNLTTTVTRKPTTKVASKTKLEKCPMCEGTGLVGQWVNCQSCGGTGQIGDEPCPKCEGSGKVFKSNSLKCPVCGGTGLVKSGSVGMI